MTAMISGIVIALWLGATPEITASVMPKSVTKPIAIAVGQSLGGIPSISAVCVMFAGVLGAVFGHALFNMLKIIPLFARGLTMGTASHALGTARCPEVNYQEGAFGSRALVICGIITLLLTPILFPVLLRLCT